MLVNFGEASIHYNIPPDKLAKEFARYDKEDKTKFFNALAHYMDFFEAIEIERLSDDAKYLLRRLGEIANESHKKGDL